MAQGKTEPDTPATVRYTRIEGTREEKLEKLDKIMSAAGLNWAKAPEGWQDPFRPKTVGTYSLWPKIENIFPWQNNGVKAGRTWIIAPDEKTLAKRLAIIEKADEKEKPFLFKDSPTGKKFNDKSTTQLPPSKETLPPLSKTESFSSIRIVPYSYRSFDKQFIIGDARFLDRPGPQVWHVHSDKQVYLMGLFSIPLDIGPGLVACAEMSDLDSFRGSYGAKAVMPLYLDREADKANITSGLLELLGDVAPGDLAGYVYCLLAHPEYTQKFADKLVNREVRVPLTKNTKLFSEAAEFGKKLIWLHTYGERFYNSQDRPKGKIPNGEAKCVKAVSDSGDKYPNEFSYNEATKTITVGDGAFAPVAKEVWEFEVSGFKPVQSWLGYRMRERKGKKSSPLDDIHPSSWTYEFTREFLELLWVMQKTIDSYPAQKDLFERVLESDLFTADELPPVPDDAREGQKLPKFKKNETVLW